MTKLQISKSHQVDKYQKEIFYNIRDKIQLSTKNMSTNQPLKKRDDKIINIFEVMKKKDVKV